MKVTPVGRKFGKYAPGDEFDFPDRPAKVYIGIGKLREVTSAGLVYQTRMMSAVPFQPGRYAPDSSGNVQNSVDAPYGLKKDGTPKARPGRAPLVDE